MHEAGCSGLVHWDDLRDGMGSGWEGGSGWGTHVLPWLIHVNIWQKPPQYCKVISLQLKFKKISRIFCSVLYWAKYLIENWRISNKTHIPFSNEQGEKEGASGPQERFLYFLMVEKGRRIILWDTWKLNEIWILVSINESLMEHSHIHLFTYCLWLMLEMNSCDRG